MFVLYILMEFMIKHLQMNKNIHTLSLAKIVKKTPTGLHSHRTVESRKQNT